MLKIIKTKISMRKDGIFSVALSVRLLFPGVTWHFSLKSSDFPQLINNCECSDTKNIITYLKY